MLFQEQNIWGAYFNTIIIALGSTAVNLVCTSGIASRTYISEFRAKEVPYRGASDYNVFWRWNCSYLYIDTESASDEHLVGTDSS